MPFRSVTWSFGLLAVAWSLAFPAQGIAAGSALGPSARVRAYPADDVKPTPGKAHRQAFERLALDPGALKDAKTRAANGPSAPTEPSAPSSPSPSLPGTNVFGPLNQPGLAATDNTPANNGSPPDPTGAIGPTHYVEFVNSKVGVYSRTDLSPVGQRDLDVFVGRSGDDVFDPQIQWDPAGGRWLYLAVDIDAFGRNFLAFGWSKAADPSDLVNGWCRFVVSTDLGGRTGLDDYPKLGHDNTRIIFGANAFRGNSFLTAHVWSVAKPANGDTSCGAPPAPAVFGSSASPLATSDGTLVFTPVPANTADSSASGYIVAADSPLVLSSPSQIMAWHMGGTAASPTLVPDGNINVTSYAIPANVPQPGTSNVLDSSDARLTQAVAHADPDAPGGEAVWTQHTVAGTGGRSVVRWYELLPASLTARQQGTVQDPAHYVFNGAISPAMVGSSAVVNYNIGSSTLRAEVRAQSRQTGMTLGQMANEVVLAASAASDQDFTCTAPNGPPCRWGDYAGASPDPNDDHVVWGSNQLNGPFTSDPHWQTRNFAILEGTESGYPRPRGATPVRVSLAVAYAPCTSPNRMHGGPLNAGSCAPPAQASGFLTVGTLDANGATANSVGSVRLDSVLGDPATPADEADVKIGVSTTDVRRTGTLVDYTGELLASVSLRMTDRNNGASQTEPATAADLAYSVPVTCQATVDASVGSACAVTTTADALAPGTVLENKRSIWQLGQINVLDGGPDGVASTTGNTLFETQGVFVP